MLTNERIAELAAYDDDDWYELAGTWNPDLYGELRSLASELVALRSTPQDKGATQC